MKIRTNIVATIYSRQLLALVRDVILTGTTLILILTSIPAYAQNHSQALDSLLNWNAQDTLLAERISYIDFIEHVLAHNLDYAVQKYNISVAEAQIEVAKVYPDPTLSASFDKDITGGLPFDSLYGNILSIGAQQTILLGGKISHSVAVAEENRNTAEANVQEFFWTLRATASQAYIAAAIADSNFKAAVHTYMDLAELAEINAHRVGAGDLAKTDYVQSRVDAIQARGAVLQADITRRQAFLQLGELIGGQRDKMLRPNGSISVPDRTFDEDTLISRAKENRPDIIAAQHELASASASLELARAMRWPDVTVGLSYTQIGSTAAMPSPFPQEKELGVNLSIPLPISAAVNRGSLEVAEQTLAQSRDSLAALELSVETNVRQAYASYELALEQYRIYSTDLLHDAENVRNARLYSYKAGNAELLDVLTAENTLSTIYQAYYTSLSNYADALVQLEQAAGVWDLTF